MSLTLICLLFSSVRFVLLLYAKHDGELAGRQQLLVVLGVQAVGRRQGKAVPDQDGAARAVEVVAICSSVLIPEK